MSNDARASADIPYARVYGGTLEEFVRRRDTLTKELRSAGERDAANVVKALRKPSRTAWALDQGAITAHDTLDALVTAVAETVEAQTRSGDVRAAAWTLRAHTSIMRSCSRKTPMPACARRRRTHAQRANARIGHASRQRKRGPP